MTEEEKRGRGRPVVSEEEALTTVSMRLTRAQYDVYKALGGVRWFREYLDKQRAKQARAK